MKKRLIIEGEMVQDVGYRLFLFDIAETYGLKGFYAKNVDKNVEVLIEGDEISVENFLKDAREVYPEYALVKNVIVEDYKGYVTHVENFYRSFSLQQLTKIVNAGLGLLGKQDIMIGKQDKMLEKQDIMIEKQDKMLEKQDILTEEVRMLRNDLKSFVEERFSRIEHDIAVIKKKVGLK